jgi:hypothetical protein
VQKLVVTALGFGCAVELGETEERDEAAAGEEAESEGDGDESSAEGGKVVDGGRLGWWSGRRSGTRGWVGSAWAE